MSTFVKQSGKSNILIYSKVSKCHTLPKFRLRNCLTACLPAVRPGSATGVRADLQISIGYVQSRWI